MPYTSQAVANAYLDLAEASGEAITPMKAQKLVFYAHGWHLAITDGQPLIDERVQAWRYGPVIKSLYADLVEYGNGPITKRIKATIWERRDGRLHLAIVEPNLPPADAGEGVGRELVKQVWSTYGRHTGVQLSNMSHLPGTPWEQTVRKYGGVEKLPKYVVIPDDVIRDYFKAQAGK